MARSPGSTVTGCTARKGDKMAKLTGTSTIVLNAESEKLWKKLKEKFKYSSDTGFLLFLLDLGERELFWRRREKRRRKGKNTSHSSGSSEEVEPEKKKCKFSYLSRSEYHVSNDRKRWKKKKVVAVKFKYLGDRSYEVSGPLNHKSLTDVSDDSSDEGKPENRKVLVDRSVNTDSTEGNRQRVTPSSLSKQLDYLMRKGQINLPLSRAGFPRQDAHPTKPKNGTYREILDEQTGEFIKLFDHSERERNKVGSLWRQEGRMPHCNDASTVFLQDLGNAMSSSSYDQTARLKDTTVTAKADSSQYGNCSAQSSILPQFEDHSEPPFSEFSDQTILPRFDTQEGSELMAVLGTQGSEVNQFGPFGETPNVSSALTGFGGDPNLNSAYVQFGGKLLSTDDSMLVQFDGDQNIEPSSEYSQSAASTAIHGFGGKGFSTQPSGDMFLGNTDPGDGNGFLNFGGKANSGIEGIDGADDFDSDQPHQTTVPRMDVPASDSPLPRFGEEGSVKTRFPGYHGKILSVELPKNVLDDCDGDESHDSLESLEPSSPNRRHVSNDVRSVDVVSKEARGTAHGKGIPSPGAMQQQNTGKESPSFPHHHFLQQGNSSSQQMSSLNTVGSVKEEKHVHELNNSLDASLKREEDMLSDGKSSPEFGPYLPYKKSDQVETCLDLQQKTSRLCSKRTGTPKSESSKYLSVKRQQPRTASSSLIMEDKDDLLALEVKSEEQMTQSSVLPRFLGKTGSELMSVKFKSHLLVESLLGHGHAQSSEPCSGPSQESIAVNPQKSDSEINEDALLPSNSSQHIDVSRPNKTISSKNNSTESKDAETDETLPSDFKLKKIDPKHGLSVISLVGAPAGYEFGPLEGLAIQEKEIPDDCDMRGIWQVGPDDAPKFLSTRDPAHSNWLRHVRPAPRQDTSNCLTVSIGGQLFFRAKQSITKGEELLYWTIDNSSKGMRKRLGRTNCGACNLAFAHPLYFRMHCLIFHDPELRLNVRKYFCKICGLPFVGRDTIVEHAVSAHEGRGAYQCVYCSKFFLKGKSLETHKNYGCAANPRRSKPQCDVCGQTFCQPQKLMTHKRRMHSCMEEVIKEFQCQSCKKILGSNAGLLRHKKEVHGKERAADTCDRCGKVFPNKTNLKVHMLTHSGIRPYKCQMEGCAAAYTSKQGLQSHYKRAHNLTGDDVPKIERTVEYTFDAYCGTPKKNKDVPEPEVIAPSHSSAAPSDVDDPRESTQSEAESPLSVGCSLDVPVTSVRPCGYDSETSFTTKENLCGSEPEIEYEEDSVPQRRNIMCDSKEVKRWLFKNENSTAGFLVDEAISAVEKDIGKEMSGDLAPYDGLRPYGSSPPLEASRDFLKVSQILRENAPRDYNISSLIREDLTEVDGDIRVRAFTDPIKDPQISDDRSRFYREDSRDDPGEYRRTDLYRRDGYDLSYTAERSSEAQNLCLKEKGLQLDLSYKGYEGFDDLNRDTAGLEGLLASEQGTQPLGTRGLQGLSPRYHPSYDGETVDLTLPRLPYPSSPIYPPLDLPGRFDLPSGISLLDFRNHLGLSPHRFSGPRVVSNGGSTSPTTAYPVFQPQYSAPTGRHSPNYPFHPHSAYY